MVTANLRYCTAQNVYSDILELFLPHGLHNCCYSQAGKMYKREMTFKGHMFLQNFKKIGQRGFNFEIITQPVYGRTDRHSLKTGFRSSFVYLNSNAGDTSSLHPE
jgi:hypothetical protein